MISTPAVVDVPLQVDEHGKIRVGNTRVLLELVIRAFQQGETPEGIVDSYPSLHLADVYAVITYYLTHRADITDYMQQADARAENLQQAIEADYSPDVLALRARLRAKLESNKRSV